MDGLVWDSCVVENIYFSRTMIIEPLKVTSPITGSTNVRLEAIILKEIIIEQYRAIGICVERFFEDVPEIRLYECLDTCYRFYYPLSIDGDSDFYQALQHFPWYYKDWKWEYTKVAEILEGQSGSVLEIGCGNGAFIKYLETRGFKCTGLELNEKAVLEGKDLGLNVKNELLNQHASRIGQVYDIVCSFQVLEHIAEAGIFIRDSLKLLKKGGLLIIAVPNNDSLLVKKGAGAFNIPPHHMGLWDKRSLQKIVTIFDIKLCNVHFEPLAGLELEKYKNIRFSPLIDWGYVFNWRLGYIVNQSLRFLMRNMKNKFFGHTVVAVYKKA